MRGVLRWFRSRRALHRGLDQMRADDVAAFEAAEAALKAKEQAMEQRFRSAAEEAEGGMRKAFAEMAAKLAAKEDELLTAQRRAALAEELLQAQREGLAAMVKAFQLEQALNLTGIERLKAKGG